jgi:hypothetical protein
MKHMTPSAAAIYRDVVLAPTRTQRYGLAVLYITFVWLYPRWKTLPLPSAFEAPVKLQRLENISATMQVLGMQR